mgnify:CR=1 FL=1
MAPSRLQQGRHVGLPGEGGLLQPDSSGELSRESERPKSSVRPEAEAGKGLSCLRHEFCDTSAIILKSCEKEDDKSYGGATIARQNCSPGTIFLIGRVDRCNCTLTAIYAKRPMDTLNHDESATWCLRLRARRKELGLTLKDVAKRCDLSFSFISQIERGMTMPSITTLFQLAQALETTVGQLLNKPGPVGGMETRRGARKPFFLGPKSASYERLSARFPGSVLNGTLITEPPGRRTEPMSHQGEELIFILKGELTVEVEGEVFLLEEGDSLHFDSNRPHITANHTDQPTTYLHTCTMEFFEGEDNLTA